MYDPVQWIGGRCAVGLRKCRDCGHQVSTDAKTCPACGAKQAKPGGCLLTTLGLFLLALGVGSWMSSNESGSTPATVQESSTSQQTTPADAAPAEETESNTALVPKWLYNSPIDPMTSKRTDIALLESINKVAFGFPYQGDQRASIMVRQSPRGGLNVIFSIERGQITCGLNSCPITVRFDDNRPERIDAEPANDGSTTHAFIPNEHNFVRQIEKAKKMQIEATFYQEGQHVFAFDVQGFDKSKLNVR